MVGFNWVYKIYQRIRWCKTSTLVTIFVSFVSNFNPYIYTAKRTLSTIKLLWMSLFEICFPQKYINFPIKSGGVRSVILQLLFSSKNGPEPADNVFPYGKLFDHTRYGLPLFCPVYCREYEHITIRRQGLRKENF
jgi:hypothetical protein